MHWTSPQHQPSHEQAEHCDRPGLSTGSKQMLQRPVPRRCLRFEMDRERRIKGLKTEETTIFHGCGVGFVAEHHIFFNICGSKGAKTWYLLFLVIFVRIDSGKIAQTLVYSQLSKSFSRKVGEKNFSILYELSGRHLNPVCCMLVNSFEGPGLVNWKCFVQLHCPLMKTLQIALKNLTRKWQNEVDTTCQGPTDSTVEFQFSQHACLRTSSIPGRDVFVPKKCFGFRHFRGARCSGWDDKTHEGDVRCASSGGPFEGGHYDP